MTSPPPMTSPRSRAMWVFGYGSLVAPTSMARTIGRVVDVDEGYVPAMLDGFGRRWNYGSLHLRGDWRHADVEVRRGVVISLGLVAADERCSGALVAVDDAELAALDWRERDYDRVDVTERIAPDRPIDGTVFTYVPRPSAVERYERARDDRRAAVRRSYWELVHATFAALGPTHLDSLHATPRPDVPVTDIDIVDTAG